jgi:Tfp pilus assembly protein PilF
MRSFTLAIATIALTTLALTPIAAAKSLLKIPPTPASNVTAQFQDLDTGNNSNTEAYLERGVKRLEAKDYQGAIEEFNQVLKIEPKNIYAYLGRGAANIYLEDYRTAKSDFDAVLQIEPNIAYAHYFRGFANYALKDNAGAIADLRKASTLFKKEGKLDLAEKADKAANNIEAK